MMNNIKFGPGSLFFGTPDGMLFQPVDAPEMIAMPEIETEMQKEVKHLVIAKDEEFTFSLKCGKKMIENFLIEAMGIKNEALSMAKDDGYAKVCHLAKYGRTRRIRKKNVRRVFRMLEKEC